MKNVLITFVLLIKSDSFYLPMGMCHLFTKFAKKKKKRMRNQQNVRESAVTTTVDRVYTKGMLFCIVCGVGCLKEFFFS